jgi:hypothetical protein
LNCNWSEKSIANIIDFGICYQFTLLDVGGLASPLLLEIEVGQLENFFDGLLGDGQR